MKRWLPILLSLGTIAASVFVKNKNSQRIAQAAEEAAGVAIQLESQKDEPVKPKKK